MVEMAMFNVQRTITPKVDNPELWFMCSAHSLIVVYICVKFCENILDSIRVMVWEQMMETLMDRWTFTQNFRWYNIIPSPLFVVGHNDKQYRSRSVGFTDQCLQC